MDFSFVAYALHLRCRDRLLPTRSLVGAGGGDGASGAQPCRGRWNHGQQPYRACCLLVDLAG
jgi:hypothetical protein